MTRADAGYNSSPDTTTHEWAGPEVCVLKLCESQQLYLRPEKLYRFEVEEGCEECEYLAAMYPSDEEDPYGDQATKEAPAA